MKSRFTGFLEGEVCVLSAACVLPSITFDIHIEAVSDTTLLQISAPAFSRLMKENIYVEAFAYKTASLRFQTLVDHAQILFMRFDQRAGCLSFRGKRGAEIRMY